MSDRPVRERSDAWMTWWVLVSFAVGGMALIASLVSIGVAVTKDSDGGASPVAAAAETPAADGVTFDIALADISLSPSSIDVPSGQQVTLHVTNTGMMDHDLKVSGTEGAPLLKAGEATDVVVGPFTEDTSAWCTVPGHKDAGMELAIHVTDAPAAAETNGTDQSPTAPVDQASATIDPNAMPATDWTPRDPVLPAKANGTVHEISMDATEQLIEVAPGVRQMMWTFNGQVPGPILHGAVGDTFRITLTNKGQVGHSIDFHASKVAWDDEMRTIQSGESLVYEFVAQFSGAFMYHCGTAPALHHIGNGMYGAIIIDPPGLEPVDKEFVVVQSELYLGPPDQPGDLKKMMAEDWDAVVFNGYVNQYKFDPIRVDANVRYRLWVVDDGPSENSAFHIVGTIFDTVFKEGAYVLKPTDSRGGAQVLDLQPAQGGFVEFTFAEDGLYPFVTHKFANVGKGALGFFAVGDADTSALGGH